VLIFVYANLFAALANDLVPLLLAVAVILPDAIFVAAQHRSVSHFIVLP
jgi:hypothetical protein